MGAQLATGTDLNTITSFGIYYYHDRVTDLINAPASAGMYMMLYVIPRAIGTRVIQIMCTTAGMFYRSQQSADQFYDWQTL